ncbi:hypothetical protein M0R04_11755 [Candidatus Dojkabacteria bacterium]|jgi:hypothetical protein|nr:hypothetical protein [Candidatus Dojkabacteria bacterium]
MKSSVDEVPYEKDKNIAIRFAGEDISFQASSWSVSVYINEEVADSLIFHLSTILQDRERRKEIHNNAGQI